MTMLKLSDATPATIGAYLSGEFQTDTRAFDRVETALKKSGIQAHHDSPLLERPTPSKAASRAMNYLARTCAASIEFLPGSKFRTWTVDRPVYRMVKGERVQAGVTQEVMDGRNPNFCLKITVVKKAKVDASVTWRVNIAHREKAGENMGHVLNVTYVNGGIEFSPGVDAQAHEVFGADLEALIRAEYARFLTNYDDQDVRGVWDAEIAACRALKVIKNTNAFIATAYLERAQALYNFVRECGHEVSWLGLDNSPMTRDSLLKDLVASIMADMDKYEAQLDAKLNTPTKERKRGDAQRERMYNTASANLDEILALAEYQQTVLGCVSEKIAERATALRSKAREFLTKDFDAGTPRAAAVEPAAETVNATVEAAIAAVEAADAADPFASVE